MANWIKRTTKSGNGGRSRNSFTINRGTGKTTRSSSYGTASKRVTTSIGSDGKEKVTTTWNGPLGTRRETKTYNHSKSSRPRRVKEFSFGSRRRGSGDDGLLGLVVLCVVIFLIITTF